MHTRSPRPTHWLRFEKLIGGRVSTLTIAWKASPASLLEPIRPAGAVELIEGIRVVTTILAFAFVLGVLVFVHELGHFMMARWHGVRVLTFSLGFGSKLLRVRRGDTEYCISAIPLGGY